MPAVTELERFAANLRRERERQGISQEALAELAGLHRTQASKIERGLREPKLSTIAKLCRALNVTPNDLYDGIL